MKYRSSFIILCVSVYFTAAPAKNLEFPTDDDGSFESLSLDFLNEDLPNLSMIEIETKEFIEDENSENAFDVSAGPCKEYNPPMPDFSAPGRRVSEVKCKEYIWDMDKRSEKARRARECEKSKPSQFKQAKPQILGGRTSLLGEFPHMAAIGWKGSTAPWIFKCGGTLISSKFVLTAGHCTMTTSRDTEVSDVVPKIVRLGTLDISNEITTNNVDKGIVQIIKHPFYKPPKKYNDIALIEMDSSVEFTRILQPACLWTNLNSLETKTAIVTGWGLTKEKDKTGSTFLQTAEVNIIDTEACDELLKPRCFRLWCGLKDGQICAGDLNGGVDTCQGDSGGPLQVKIPLNVTNEGPMYYILGVTSFGFGCGLQNTPAVYSSVAHYLDWIEHIVWPSE